MHGPHPDVPPPLRPGPLSTAAPLTRPARRSFLARHGMAAVVVLSVAAGVWLDRQVQCHPPSAPDVVARGAPSAGPRLDGPVTLRGPAASVTLPSSGPVVLHVWQAGSTDGMMAAHALAALGSLGLDVPVYPVAVGGISADWAQTHGLAEGLVFDPAGLAVARPLGVTSFTTLLLDAEGYVRFSDRPDNPGYAERLAGAVRALQSDPGNTHLP